MTIKLLELFKGTGSVGKVAERLGMFVVSLDLDPNYTPDIETDILDWNYKKFYRDTKWVPDIIWASPPCNTFSPLVYPLKERNPKTAEPLSERAILGTKILYRTLDIINWYRKINPKLNFAIENPRGMMRNDPKIKKFVRNTTYYCMYGDKRTKPTDFFSNIDLDLKDGVCRGTELIQNKKNLEYRYKIPPELVKAILTKLA